MGQFPQTDEQTISEKCTCLENVYRPTWSAHLGKYSDYPIDNDYPQSINLET